MECPACGNIMDEETFGGNGIAVCNQGCRGLWFDALRFPGLDGLAEGIGLEAFLKEPPAPESFTRPLRCPACKRPLQGHGYRGFRDILIDECYRCGGVFLSAGKLGVLRNALKEQKKRERARALEIKQDVRFQQALSVLSTASGGSSGKWGKTIFQHVPPWVRVPGFLALGAMLMAALAAILMRGC